MSPVLLVFVYAMITALATGLGAIPFAFIQGIGRPDITAKFHMVEAAFYFPCVWWLVKGYGPTGAALAWALRAGADAILLLLFARRVLLSEHPHDKFFAVCATASIGVLILPMVSLPLAIKLPVVVLTLALFVLASWHWGFEAEERSYIHDKARNFL